MIDQCALLEMDYCMLGGYCKFQTFVVRDNILQIFMGCSATTKDLLTEEEWDEINEH